MRVAHAPTPFLKRLATVLAGYGLSGRQIAFAMTLDAKTVRRHYAAELEVGQIRARAERISQAILKAPERRSPAASAAALLEGSTAAAARFTGAGHHDVA